MKIGYQLYSSRNFGPLDKTLNMLAYLGYASVEGYGGLFENADALQSLKEGLKAAGLTMPSGHFGLDMVEETPGRIIDIAKTLGLTHVFVPYLDAEARPTDAKGWRAFGERLEEAGEPFRNAGLTFGWHNHDFEFTPLADGFLPIEALLDGGPNLALEFDVAWCIRAGADANHWIDRLKDRIVAAHVKDIAPEGQTTEEDGWSDVGEGTADWAGLMPRLADAGCRMFIMEHDNPSDDARFATRSLAYLNTLDGATT